MISTSITACFHSPGSLRKLSESEIKLRVYLNSALQRVNDVTVVISILYPRSIISRSICFLCLEFS